MPILLGAAFIIIVVIVFSYARILLSKAASQSYAKFAKSLGLSFTEDQSLAAATVPGDFLLFSQGMPFSRRNVMEGMYNDVDIAVFTYTFAINLGKMREMFQQTVIHIRSLSHPIPQFHVIPMEYLNAVLRNMPTQDQKDKLLETAGIRLPKHPAFRDNYKLMGSESEKLTAIFDHEPVISAIQRLNEKPYQHMICLEGAGDHLFIYPLYKQASPKKLGQLLEKSIIFLKHLESVSGG